MQRGNVWYIATYEGDNYKWEGAPDIQPCLHPLRSEPVINFLKRAFNAQEIGRHATPDGVIHHATVKVGDSHLELGDAHGPYQPMQRHVLPLRAELRRQLYLRAMAAGGKSIAEPTDHPYGDRSGAVKDAFGNEWWIATHVKDVTSRRYGGASPCARPLGISQSAARSSPPLPLRSSPDTPRIQPGRSNATSIRRVSRRSCVSMS